MNPEDIITKKIPPEYREDHDHVAEIVTSRLDQPKAVRGRNGNIVYGCDAGGKPNKPNEDRAVINTDKNVFVSIDGMGGMGKGDQAAQILAEEFQHGIARNLPFDTIKENAHRRMEKEDIGSGGACIIAAKINGRILDVYQIGDVRLMIFDQAGQIRYQTADEGYHNTVASAIQGKKNPAFMNHERFILHPGDRIVIGSDGLTDNLETEEVGQMITGQNTLDSIKTLDKYARRRMDTKIGKPDNINVIMIDYETSNDFDIKEAINSADTLEQLYQAIEENGGIHGSRGRFSASQIRDLITLVKEQKAEPVVLTGLIRHKAIELIEASETAPYKINNATSIEELFKIMDSLSAEDKVIYYWPTVKAGIDIAVTGMREDRIGVDNLITGIPSPLVEKIYSLLQAEKQKFVGRPQPDSRPDLTKITSISSVMKNLQAVESPEATLKKAIANVRNFEEFKDVFRKHGKITLPDGRGLTIVGIEKIIEALRTADDDAKYNLMNNIPEDYGLRDKFDYLLKLDIIQRKSSFTPPPVPEASAKLPVMKPSPLKPAKPTVQPSKPKNIFGRVIDWLKEPEPPKTQEQLWEEAIKKTRTMSELEDVILKIGSIKSNHGRVYTATEMMGRILLVANGASIDTLTRAYGIREKVAKILKRELK